MRIILHLLEEDRARQVASRELEPHVQRGLQPYGHFEIVVSVLPQGFLLVVKRHVLVHVPPDEEPLGVRRPVTPREGLGVPVHRPEILHGLIQLLHVEALDGVLQGDVGEKAGELPEGRVIRRLLVLINFIFQCLLHAFDRFVDAALLYLELDSRHEVFHYLEVLVLFLFLCLDRIFDIL